MLICSAKTIRAWDQWTIEHEPIPSIDLMERAAGACAAWISDHLSQATPLSIFCGPGNNGGDGLALARMLAGMGWQVNTYYVEGFGQASPDNLINQHRLAEAGIPLMRLDKEDDLPPIREQWCVDALFGTGLSRAPTGTAASLIRAINLGARGIISIDMPSGLFSDRHSGHHPIIKATHTLSFQCLKPAFLMAENARYAGEVHVIDIGLSAHFPGLADSGFTWCDQTFVRHLYHPPRPFDHKGTRGHAALLAGSYGMAGAAILAARACLRSGCGKLTVYTDPQTYPLLQVAVPEAVFAIHASVKDRMEHLKAHDHAGIGAGPGWGTGPDQAALLTQLFSRDAAMVIDADALNTIALFPDLLMQIPRGSILTPHPKEFDRIFGNCTDEFERLRIAIEKAQSLHINILLKGHRSFLLSPEGKVHVNSTGNPGMATAGSGDVLTGILTSLLAQGMLPTQAMILGAWLHGRAGDLAARESGEEALVAGDLPSYLGKAFLSLRP